MLSFGLLRIFLSDFQVGFVLVKFIANFTQRNLTPTVVDNTKNMVTFETKVYEKDWKYILKGDYLDNMIERCNYNFSEKILFINNVKDKNRVTKYAEKKLKNGIIDSFYFVDEYSDIVLKHFDITKDSFKGGYYYSISELVSIYLCKTKYLLHFSSDSYIENSKLNWIDKAIKLFEKRNDIIVANPTWNFKYNEVRNESVSEISEFYLSFGFSDQCYLIKTEIFKNKIYNEKNIDSERYPKYGGELFEKRVDSFMRNNNLYRITSKEISYIHKNFPKKNYLNLILELLKIPYNVKQRL